MSAIWSRIGVLLTSPEAIFQASTPTRPNSATASFEKGELRNRSPRSRAWVASPAHCGSVKAVRTQYSKRVSSWGLKRTRQGSAGVVSAAAMWVWNLMPSAPAPAAASI